MSDATLIARFSRLTASGWKLDSENQLRILDTLYEQPTLSARLPAVGEKRRRAIDPSEERWASGEVKRDLRLLDLRGYIKITFSKLQRRGKKTASHNVSIPTGVALTPDGVNLIEASVADQPTAIDKKPQSESEKRSVTEEVAKGQLVEILSETGGGKNAPRRKLLKYLIDHLNSQCSIRDAIHHAWGKGATSDDNFRRMCRRINDDQLVGKVKGGHAEVRVYPEHVTLSYEGQE